jgi:hypothetical protein
MARLRGNKAGSTWQLVVFTLLIIAVLVVVFYRKQIINLFEGATTLQLVGYIFLDRPLVA